MSVSDRVGPVAQGVALAATGLFAGAALCVSVVDAPAALESKTFYRLFPPFYRRAAKLQGCLAFLGSHAAMVAAAKALSDDKASWRAAGLLLGAVWPWTVFVMLPLNKTILKQDAEGEAEQDALLQRWARLHWVRTGLSTTSLAVIVAALVSKRSSSP